jgi:DNA-binding response OmpR family regulator
MSTVAVKRLLHVEDDPMQQRLLKHHLQALEEFHFETTAVESEDEAMQAFRSGTFDLVVIDYQLTRGNGLDLLRRLRQLDPIIPIIGVSGVATSEVAAELVHAGADDYFDKRDLTSAKLARSIRNSLRRTDTVRRHNAEWSDASRGTLVEHLLEVCEYFAAHIGSELVQKLESFAMEARRRDLRAGDIEQLYRSACLRLESAGCLSPVPAQLLLRPLILELIVRMLDDPDEHAFDGISAHHSTP